MTTKCSDLRRASVLLICVGALLAGRLSSADDASLNGTTEPQAPNILEIVEVAGAAGDSIVAIDAIVRPVVDGEVELQVLSPAGLQFSGRDRAPRYQIKRGGRTHSERLLVETSPLHPTVVRVRANLRNADGEVWLSVDRELRFNERPPNPSRVRVPIVRTAPDGSRTVEYIERREAQRRGLLTNGNGKGKSSAPESDSKSSAVSPIGDDAPATPVIQE